MEWPNWFPNSRWKIMKEKLLKLSHVLTRGPNSKSHYRDLQKNKISRRLIRKPLLRCPTPVSPGHGAPYCSDRGTWGCRSEAALPNTAAPDGQGHGPVTPVALHFPGRVPSGQQFLEMPTHPQMPVYFLHPNWETQFLLVNLRKCKDQNNDGNKFWHWMI